MQRQGSLSEVARGPPGGTRPTLLQGESATPGLSLPLLNKCESRCHSSCLKHKQLAMAWVACSCRFGTFSMASIV